MRPSKWVLHFFTRPVHVWEFPGMNAFGAMVLRGLSTLLIGMLFMSPASSSGEEITSAHVFSRVQGFNRDLDLVRMELGMPKPGPNLSTVSGAATREVFYQAMTLCVKASHLHFEWTRSLGSCPPSKIGLIRSADVLEQVNAASKHLQAVKKHFKIEESLGAPPVDMTKTPTDVFMAIVEGNRQLNFLLKKRYLPDDVFREVTLAIYYAADLLGRFPNIEQRIPDEPTFTRRKTPTDVYLRLVEGFSVVRRVNVIFGENVLDIKVNEEELVRVIPSDVYDVASMIVSELTYLNWLAGGKERIEAYQPSPKIPAQVFQRAGILLLQLRMLLEQAEKQPNWLKREH